MVEQNISSLLNQDVDRLKGRQILSLDSVVGETEKCVIVYIFNYYDCETCIDKGFEIVNLIDNSKKREYVKVIVSMFHEVTSTQKRNSYRGFIYKDKNDLIRKSRRSFLSKRYNIITLPKDSPRLNRCRSLGMESNGYI